MRAISFSLALVSLGIATPSLVLSCSDSDSPPPAETGDAYRLTITKTTGGVPHVVADDLASAGFGIAYAAAPDAICDLADQIAKVNSERAKFYDDEDLLSEALAYKALGIRAQAEEIVAGELEDDARQVLEGYVAGYNYYLETTGIDNLPAPCTGAPWVRAIDTADLYAYFLELSLRGGTVPFLNYVWAAAPPGAMETSARLPDKIPNLRDKPIGSNGWGIGRERSDTGRGMLLANPHFPWQGELRFKELHVTVESEELDVYGTNAAGMPMVLIGFTKDVAWTHTVANSDHFTVYQLELDASDPTKYIFDGETRDMTSEEVTVEVSGGGTASRTFYRTHLGLMAEGAGLDWTDSVAFTIRDANTRNVGAIAMWLKVARAKSVDELRDAFFAYQANPWLNAIASDKDGNALYVDATRVPNLSAEAEATFVDNLTNDALTGILYDNGAVLLPGNDSKFEWVEAEGARDGAVPPSKAPTLKRDDYVLNANGSPWLTNANTTIDNFPLLYGGYKIPASPRTRANLKVFEETGSGALSGSDGKFTLDELADAALSNRSIMASLLVDDLVNRCDGAPPVMVDGSPVDIQDACDVLASWDRRFELDSVGAIVFREFIAGFSGANLVDAGKVFSVGFDADDPVGTPNTLTPPVVGEEDEVLIALAEAVLKLAEAGLDVDTPLGEAQFTRKNDVVIPIHGGISQEGLTNLITYSSPAAPYITSLQDVPELKRKAVVNGATGLTEEGYLINYGTSFIMAMEFTDDGPRARAHMAMSQSNDPASEFYSDGTLAFSKKEWRDLAFTPEAIEKARVGEVVTLKVPRKTPVVDGEDTADSAE